jgi:cysteine synthase
MHKNILTTIGKTPIIQLNNINKNIFVKVESFNPGGSIKDRIALAMIEDAEKKSLIKKGDTIIEPTSGNTGIGLALVCAVKGYKLILTMPESMSIERRKILKSYGAELILTPEEDGMKGAIKAAELLSKNNGYFQPQQFKNLSNPRIHRETTAKEILEEIKYIGKLDYFVAGVGTGGTLTGVGEILHEKYPNINIVAVEPMESAVLSGNKPSPHKIQGIGAGFIPDILNTKIYNRIMMVSYDEALTSSRRLAKEEGIFGGISSGANLFASLLISKENPNKNILTIIADTGERYLSTDLVECD